MTDSSVQHHLGYRLRSAAGLSLLAIIAVFLSACTDGIWNNPYPVSEKAQNILYSSFTERPKHLDPVRAYSADEYAFIGQIYEPLLQYHFLKRPYQLVPLAAAEVPEAKLYDEAGSLLPSGANAEEVAYSIYDIQIKRGMRYQPHPALARDESGAYRYHRLSAERIAAVNTLADFAETGTREVTAEDFYNQIKRLAFPRLNSPVSGVLGEYIVGFNQLAEALRKANDLLRQESGLDKPYLDLRPFRMQGVEVVDRYHLRIRLHGKYPQFVYWLAMPFFAPMPWEAEAFYSQPGLDRRNVNLNWYPLGSGPFMLEENNPNLRMVMAANPNFHGENYPREGEAGDRATGLLDDAGKSLPFIQKASYSLEKESIPYWSKFLQGYYDTSGISSDSFDQAIRFSASGELGLSDAMQAKGIRLLTAVTTSVFYMGFNMADATVGGDSQRARLLRRAISIAMDFEEYISIFNNGRGVAAQSPLPPGIFGHRAGAEGMNPYVYQLREGIPRRKPIEAAQALMRQAGYPGGRDLTTGKPLVLYYDTTSSGPDGKARLNWIRKQFAKLGVQLVIRASDYNRFREKTRKGTAQIFMWGWNADYPDPENFLFLLYGPNGKVEHGGENASNYQNDEFDRLFVRMKNMENGPERQQLVDRMVEILRRDAPWVWGFFPKAFSLHHSWYHNVKPNLMANNTLKYKRLDPELRDAQRRHWNQPVAWPVVLLLVLLVASAVPAWLLYRRRERSSAR